MLKSFRTYLSGALRRAANALDGRDEFKSSYLWSIQDDGYEVSLFIGEGGSANPLRIPESAVFARRAARELLDERDSVKLSVYGAAGS